MVKQFQEAMRRVSLKFPHAARKLKRSLNKLKFRTSHVYCPHKLLSLRFIVDLFYRNIVLFTPRYGDPWVQVVELRGSQGDILIFIL